MPDLKVKEIFFFFFPVDRVNPRFNLHPKSGQRVTLVVEKGSKSVPGSRVDPASDQDSHNRCQRFRLGSTLGSQVGTRDLEERGRSKILQLEGAESSRTSTQILSGGTSGTTCENPFGQFPNSSLHQQAGGYKKLLPMASGRSHPEVGRTQCIVPVGNPLEGGSEPDSGLPQQNNSEGRRLDLKSGGIQHDRSEMGNTMHRPLCLETQYQDKSFLLPKQMGRGAGNRRTG